MTIYLLCAEIVLIGLFIFVEVSHRPQLAMFLKGFASFGFIAVLISVLTDRLVLADGMIAGEQRLLPVALVILPGLVCGLLGDVYLALRPLRPKAEDSHLILGGVVFFATGHLFYLAALLMMGEFSGWAILFSVLISILIYLSAGWMKLTWEKSKVPCMIYSFLIFLMIGQAFANAAAAGFDSMTAIFFAGALLFGISDLILSQIYFKGQNDNKVFIIANLSTYYAAQVLIALALLYF